MMHILRRFPGESRTRQILDATFLIESYRNQLPLWVLISRFLTRSTSYKTVTSSSLKWSQDRRVAPLTLAIHHNFGDHLWRLRSSHLKAPNLNTRTFNYISHYFESQSCKELRILEPMISLHTENVPHPIRSQGTGSPRPWKAVFARIYGIFPS